jgi:hypothetical protein
MLMSKAAGRLLLVILGATVLASPSGSSLAVPPGNNGTIKVDGVAFDDHPNNEPHVGCSFQVDMYGYDAGDLEAALTFTGIPPTGGGTLAGDRLSIGEDAAGGGTDLDASGDYDLAAELSGIEPHAVQGHHVKLTIHAEGSIGADVKHKVFWVEGCSTGPEDPGDPGDPGDGDPGEANDPPAADPADPVEGDPAFAG